jgi:hypothetical protein
MASGEPLRGTAVQQRRQFKEGKGYILAGRIERFANRDPVNLVARLVHRKTVHRPGGLDRDGKRVITKVVAGTGFEPVTFRL